MPGVFTQTQPTNGQVDGVPLVGPPTRQDKIPYNVAIIIVASAAVLIALDRFKFRFAIGI